MGAAGDLQPDLTLWFDLDPPLAAERRAAARAARTASSSRTSAFFERVRAGYRARDASRTRTASCASTRLRKRAKSGARSSRRCKGADGSERRIGATAAALARRAARSAHCVQRAHALLLHGPEGVGQFELGLALAQAWLCEGPAERRPHGAGCGARRSCHLIDARSHPDLLVLVPEALRESLGWSNAGDGEEGGGSEKGSKAKPSKEIKVEAVRAAVGFAQTTSARGRGKVLVLHPAERMNAIAANTLLKTLEEPPGAARFVLSSAAPDALLPTIRSRCQALRLVLPPHAAAAAWLSARGVAEATALLAACGGKPLQALAWHEEGIDARLWPRIPAAARPWRCAAVHGLAVAAPRRDAAEGVPRHAERHAPARRRATFRPGR